MITCCPLSRPEILQIWTINRSEIIENIYSYENGALVLKPDTFDVRGWPSGEPEKYTPILRDGFDLGGWFCGAFEDDKLVGVAILENKFIGPAKDQLQLSFLHVSHPYRGTGLGKRLFALARTQARERGAKKMYVSATPSEHAIHFYLRQGCEVTPDPDPELYDLEPKDIHLVCAVEML